VQEDISRTVSDESGMKNNAKDAIKMFHHLTQTTHVKKG
jgi:hypothetical protein